MIDLKNPNDLHIAGKLSGKSGYDKNIHGDFDEIGWMEAFREIHPTLRTMRKLLGLTQQQMGMKLKVSNSTIKRLEKGQKPLPLTLLSNAKFDPSQPA